MRASIFSLNFRSRPFAVAGHGAKRHSQPKKFRSVPEALWALGIVFAKSGVLRREREPWRDAAAFFGCGSHANIWRALRFPPRLHAAKFEHHRRQLTLQRVFIAAEPAAHTPLQETIERAPKGKDVVYGGGTEPGRARASC